MRISSNKNYALLDLDTGETIDSGVYIIDEETYTKRKIRNDAKRLSEIKRKANDPESTDHHFTFHVFYQGCIEQNFPNMDPSHLTRLMYSATYLGYDGYLRVNSTTAISKVMLQRRLKLSNNQFYDFWNDMVERKIFIERGRNIQLNPDLFFRGKVSDKRIYKMAIDNKHITRLYVNGIRSLYERATPRSHKTLSYIFRVIPYVNKQFNIVCKNPQETKYDLVEPMTLGEFADIIGYSRKNIRRLAASMLDSTFITADGDESTAIRFVLTKSLNKELMQIFINPRVYYAGDYDDNVRVLGIFN